MKLSFCIYFSLLTFSNLFLPSHLFCQTNYEADSPKYELEKAKQARNNKLQNKDTTLPDASELDNVSTSFFRSCKALIGVDSSFSVVPFDTSSFVHAPQYRNDDKSTQAIPLPFNFCFYGQNYNSVYINNNGSISFGTPYGTFVPDSFPTKFYRMIAPFWADVDTRNLQSGLVYYQITASHLIVTWDHVGYYSNHADKLNTFQLIITDGLDSLLRPGKNVSFRYDEMEWSTGDIGGINGFTDPPATIGANFGDSIKFIQFGRFAKSGQMYDGPFGAWDGVSWLNGRVFEFSVCASANIEPIVNNFNFCDTLYSCVGDTINLDLSFLSPEVDQITSCTIVASNTSGLTILENSPGIVNTIRAKYVGNLSNIGLQNIIYTATDNGTPPASIQLKLTLKINPFYDTISVFSNKQNICPNTTTLLTATPGFDKYKWSNNKTTATIQAAAGNYFVVGSKGNCYVRSDTISVAAIPVTVPIISGNDSTLICKRDSTLFQVLSSFPNYLWNNGDTTQTAYLPPGIINVLITDTNGCKVKSANAFVPNFQLQPVNILGIKKICPSDSLLLRASAGFLSYFWSTGSTDTAIIAPAGNYSVIATDSNNCKNYSAIQTIPTFSVLIPKIQGSANYCFGDSVELTFTPAYTNFYWSTLDTSAKIFVKKGNYFVTATDGNLCTIQSDTFHVESFPVEPLLVLGANGFCPGDSALLIASPGFSSYLWERGDSTQSIYAHAGIFKLSATDTNGCVSKGASAQIQQYSVTNPSISGIFTVCPNDSTNLLASPGFKTYFWSSGDTVASVYLPAGTYSVQVKDSNSCPSQSSLIQVGNYSVKNPVITGNSFCCYNDSSLLAASPGFTNYYWSSGDTTVSAMQVPGAYFVEVSDSNNCKTKNGTAFTLNPYPFNLPLLNGSNYYCKGDSVKLFLNTTYTSYLWSNGDTDSSTYVLSGNHSVLVTDQYNCKLSSNKLLVQQFQEQVLQIIGKHYFCEDDSVLLQINPGFKQTVWNTGSTASAIYVKSGVYSLHARDSNNCKSSSLPFVTLTSIPVVKILGEQTICENDSQLLSLSNTFANYIWSNGSTQTEIYAKPGNYFVKVIDSVGCDALDSAMVDSLVLPSAFFTIEQGEQEINTPVQFFNSSQSPGSALVNYSWSINNASPFSFQSNANYSFLDSGSFIVQLLVTDANGCSDSYSETIQITKPLLIPNIITPNGDGENDAFVIDNLNLTESNSFTVFDRWGKIIFTSSNFKNDWKTDTIKDGVYYYLLVQENKKEINGFFTVLH